MKVNYSIGVKLGGSGIGSIAYRGASAFAKQKFLQDTYAVGFSEQAKRLGHPHDLGLTKVIRSEPWRDVAFDLLTSQLLSKSAIFYGWAAHSLYSLKSAHQKGATTVLDRSSVEASRQQKLLNDEYQKWGYPGFNIPDISLKRMLQEYQETDFIIVSSQFIADSFKDSYYYKKIRVNPLGVDLDKFQERQDFDQNHFTLTFLGEVGIRKGVPYLLEAWTKLQLKNATLQLLGPIRPEIPQLIKSRGWNMSNVEMPGFVDDPHQKLKQSSLFAFPSIEDGFGLVVLEAMSSSVPVVVSQSTGAKECLRDGQDGFLIKTGNSSELSDKINYFYQHRDQVEKFGRSARKQAQKYSWQEYERRLIDLVKKL